MPVHYLSEADVAATLDVAMTVDLLDAAARAIAAGEAIVLPRQRARHSRAALTIRAGLSVDGRCLVATELAAVLFQEGHRKKMRKIYATCA